MTNLSFSVPSVPPWLIKTRHIMRNLGSKLFMLLVAAAIVGGLAYAFVPRPRRGRSRENRSRHRPRHRR